MKETNRHKMDYHEHDALPQEVLPESPVVASVNECTGLMHATPETEGEFAAYQQLSPMAIPRREPRLPTQERRCPGKGRANAHRE